MDSERLYLDYNATSPLSQSVNNWLKSGDFYFANPSSQHSSGKASRKLINQVREQIFKIFKVDEKNYKLFFHSGATEGILTFAAGLVHFAKKNNKKLYFCLSEIDHPVVQSLIEWKNCDVEIIYLKRNISLEYTHDENLSLIKSLKEKDPESIFLYHHLWVHNETGLVSPLEELEEFKKIPDLYIHVDAVQTVAKVLDWNSLKYGDIFTYSAHKFGALKSCGFSFFQKDVPFTPLITGGGQQNSLRSGTENPMAVQSIGLALADASRIDVQRTMLIHQRLEKFLEAELKGIGQVIKHSKQCSNTLYFYLDHLSSDIALAMFDLGGLEISAGSACSSGAAKESAVLLALGKKAFAKNGLRLSFSMNISEKDLNLIQEKSQKIFQKLRTSI